MFEQARGREGGGRGGGGPEMETRSKNERKVPF